MAKKRANGEGNIRKRADDRWEGRYTAGYNADTGKRIIGNVLGKTQTEVKETLKKAIGETAGLDISRTDDYTVAAWLHTWYQLYAKPNLRLATQNHYELMMNIYAIPRIGDIKLGKLTSRDLQKLYKALQENGRVHTTVKSGKGLSSSTVHSLHLMLHCAFERAIKERLIQRNSTDDCMAPKVRKVEMNVLSSESIKAYLKAVAQRNALPMFYLELVALLWSDVDTAHNTISVSKQYVCNLNGECVLSQPKTENSVRLVSVPQEAIDLLITEHNKHPDSPCLFPSPIIGGMYHPDSVVNIHKRILNGAGLPHLKFHKLRHTFATTALQNGVDVKTVSAMLGHYDAGFTLRTYTHATLQAQDAAAITIISPKIARPPNRIPVRWSLFLFGCFRMWVTVLVRNFQQINFKYFTRKNHRFP